MSLFIGYESALECLRSANFSDRSARCRAIPKNNCVPTKKDVRRIDFEATGLKRFPLDIVVANAASRGRSKLVSCHVWTGSSSARSFICLEKNLYVSSPEACFLQLATVLSCVQLIRVGYELCGTYALDEDAPAGFRSRAQPLVTAAVLQRYVLKAKGVKGRKRALEALRFIADGSASPMETVLTMLLSLSSALGGYGLSLPRLNHLVEMPEEVRHATGRARCFCDLCWPAAKLAVEYESDLYHSGSEDVSRDSKRRTALARAEFTVVTVTWAQVRDARELDEVARVLAKHVGKRVRISRSDWLTRRYDLRFQIMPQTEPKRG